MNQIDRLLRSLTNITPDADQVRRIEGVRRFAKELATEIEAACPSSRETSLAFTHLEETVMWAVKSIVMEDGQ